MSRGDSVEIVVDVGAGASRSFTIEADKNGRTVEVSHLKGGMVEVAVLPRRVGKTEPTPIRTAQFAQARVIAIVEHKVEVPDKPKQEALL